nr:MAG TPA: hypothetical protein [Caudoviricetes sp.]
MASGKLLKCPFVIWLHPPDQRKNLLAARSESLGALYRTGAPVNVHAQNMCVFFWRNIIIYFDFPIDVYTH